MKPKIWIVYDRAMRSIHSVAPSRQKAHEFARVWNDVSDCCGKANWHIVAKQTGDGKGRRFVAAKLVLEGF